MTAKTEKLKLPFNQIPYESLVEIAKIFQEGQEKYGKGNWRFGGDSPEYMDERWNHAFRHLCLFNELDFSENTPYEHLAKVAWYAITTISILKQMHSREKGETGLKGEAIDGLAKDNKTQPEGEVEFGTRTRSIFDKI